MSQFARDILKIIRGDGITHTLYPLVATGIPGVTVTSGAGAWGADKEIIAAAAIAGDFWIERVDLDTFAGGAVQPMLLEIEIAGATSVFAMRFDQTAVTTNLGPFAVWPPRKIPGGSQITARAWGAAARTINMSVMVAQGL